MAAVAITPATRIPSVISSRCARIRRVGCDANLRRCVRGAAARAGQPPHGNSHLLRRLQWPTLRVKAATTGAPLGRGCRLEAVASSSADAAACSTPETDAKKQVRMRFPPPSGPGARRGLQPFNRRHDTSYDVCQQSKAKKNRAFFQSDGRSGGDTSRVRLLQENLPSPKP